ncbi:hypothetical protein [Jiangella asiatica]|uniref:Uncharacterized protein n=1 Tax=Jiangella asiatica TaxID=2530372 RepID=A0A4R5DTG4_9ACTN|nr:hypothetical protein [Jiangella asiatica]TDE14183.1 hypothetical protein E1269_03185 [Jiangella asiatica]
MSRDERLPVVDYDQISIETLQQVIMRLNHDELRQLSAYESEHADRPLVKRILEARMAQLESVV